MNTNKILTTLCAAIAVSFFVLTSHAAAYAGSLSVTVSNKKGQLIENAVVMLKPLFEMTKGMPEIEGAEVRQENALFAPFVLAVPVGTKVSFPNYDEFRHHVYSFSKAKRFELRLYGKDETNAIVFEEPGVVALGCNIHDNMLAYIYVSTAPILAKTGENGLAVFDDLQVGEYELTYWHPGVTRKGVPQPKTIQVGEGAMSEIAVLELRRVWGEQSPPAEGQY